MKNMEEKEDGERADVQIPKMEDPKWSFFIPGLLVKFTIHGWLNSKKTSNYCWLIPHGWLNPHSSWLDPSFLIYGTAIWDSDSLNPSESFTAQKILGVSPDVSQRPGSVFPTAQELCVFDLTVAAVPAAGVAADLGHLARHQQPSNPRPGRNKTDGVSRMKKLWYLW